MATKIRILKTGRTMTVAASQARGLVRAGIAEVVVEVAPADVPPATTAPAPEATTSSTEATQDGPNADAKKRKYQRRDMKAEG